MKDQDLINLLNRAAAVIEDPESEIRSHREELVEDLLSAAKCHRLQSDTNEILDPPQRSASSAPTEMYDWRAPIASGPEVDARPWTLDLVEGSEVSFRFHARCPDGTERQVWIEIQDGKLVIHAYDPAHEEPVNLRIGKTGITVDSDRDDEAPKRYGLGRHDTIEDFVRQMADMSLPEEECREIEMDSVEDYIADFDDDRLFGEYSTFMDMVRAARELVK